MKKMKKQVLAIVMVFAMALSLAACGGSSDKKETAKETTEDSTEAEETEGWYEYSDLLTVCYQGMTDAGELAVFAASDDMDFAVLGIADPETAKSVSYVGDLTEDESTGYLTITDETSETTLTFEVIDNGDDTLTLDMGDTGKVTITSCTQDEAFELLDTLEEYTEPVS